MRTQKCMIHSCILSMHKATTIFVPNFGGQLVHLDMATGFKTSSRRRPGFESGHPNVNVWIYVCMYLCSEEEMLLFFREINLLCLFWNPIVFEICRFFSWNQPACMKRRVVAAQCRNYGNLLSLFFGTNFVKVTFLLKKLLNR